jgi:hypothetical protein
MVIEIHVGRIGPQRLARLLDRLVDRPQVVFENPDRLRVEPATARVERLLEVGNGLAVLGSANATRDGEGAGASSCST